jgi:hypothetical protein
MSILYITDRWACVMVTAQGKSGTAGKEMFPLQDHLRRIRINSLGHRYVECHFPVAVVLFWHLKTLHAYSMNVM